MKKIQRIVIADDLTGSNDTGVHFLAADNEVVVVVDPKKDSSTPTADTVVINTDSRLCSRETAYQKVSESMNAYVHPRPKEIYKKVDSTLRGNVGAEIDAVMDTVGFHLACVATATPRNGRTVKNGVCYVNGVELGDTEMAKDPFTPVHFSDIRKIITAQSRRSTELLPLEIIRSPFAEAQSYLTKLVEAGAEIIVSDAETVDDLRVSTRLFEHLAQQVLYVGSAGLFHAMKDTAVTHTDRVALNTDNTPKILFVVGSLMETTLSQVEYMQQRNPIHISMLSTENLLSELESEIKLQIDSINSAYQQSDIVLLRTDRSKTDESLVASKVGSTLGRVVKGVVNATELDAMVVTGGDTALNVLRSLEIGSIKLIDEVSPGIPISTIQIPGSTKPTLFVTKAGSYGESNALAGVLDYLGTTGVKI